MNTTTKKPMSMGKKILYGFLAFTLLGMVTTGIYRSTLSPEELALEREQNMKAAMAELTKVENSPVDGSVRQCKEYLKANLRDWDSYESVEWTVVERSGDTYRVQHKFRSKNGFGGTNLEHWIFTLDTLGIVIGAQSY